MADRVRLGQQLVDNLEMGIEYKGICRNELHQVWLANVADRDACCIITKQPHRFEPCLSAMTKKHFQEVLDLCEAKLVYKVVKFVLTRRYNESARET